MKDIYNKENLEKLAFDLIKYLYKTKDYNEQRLTKNVFIYSMNKVYYVSKENSNFMLNNIPIIIEDNVKMEDYFEFYNAKTLTLSMDSTLCDYLYYGDVLGAKDVQNRIRNIFKKHGFYYDFGSNWYLFAEPLTNNKT